MDCFFPGRKRRTKRTSRLVDQGLADFAAAGSRPQARAVSSAGLVAMGHDANGSARVLDVACSYFSTVALAADGRVYIWGADKRAYTACLPPFCAPGRALPHDVAGLRLAPRRRAGPRGELVLRKQLACGWEHFVVVSERGEVFVWGEGRSGQLGLADGQSVRTPRRIDALWPQHVITQVACGDTHTICLSDAGNVFAFGSNGYGELGDGGVSDETWAPQLVAALAQRGVASVAAGSNHSAARTASGQVLTWGRGSHGRLGHGDEEDVGTPRVVESLPAVAHVYCGGEFTVAVTHTGDVYTWGRAAHGALGHGDCDMDALAPCLVSALSGHRVVHMACGVRHCLAWTARGELFAWGSVFGGDNPVPRLFPNDWSMPIERMAAGLAHSALLTTHGVLLTFGRGDQGQLGHGDFLDEYSPTVVHALCGRVSLSPLASASADADCELVDAPSDGAMRAIALAVEIGGSAAPTGTETDERDDG